MDIKLLNGEQIAGIGKSFLFENVNADVVKRVLSDPLCELAAFHKGETIYNAREYRRSIGYILSGTIQVSKTTADGHRYIMNTLSPGSCFGVAAVFCDSHEYVTELTASVPCGIVFFSQPLLEKIMAENPAVALSYVSFLSDRVRFLNNKIQGLISASAGQALANYLMNSCAEADDAFVVRLDGSISSLAHKLNIGRSSLYRSFNDLEQCGLISREGRNIRILNPEGLIKYISAY